MARRHNPFLLNLIAMFKLLKGVLLLIVAIRLLRLVHEDLHEVLGHWVDQLRLDPHNHYIHSALERLAGLSPAKLRALSVGTFIYGGLYFVEGLGLLRDKLWAEWLTVITTAGFVPFEIYEVYRHFTWLRLGLLAFNVLILAYLIHRLYQRHQEYKRRQSGADAPVDT